MSSELEQHSPNRPHSIDLTLELERELDNEASPPNSPGVSNRPQSLDASVLASIVTQLRFSLEEVTKERDGLVELLDKSTRKQADLQDNLQLMTDRSSSLEDQLSAAQDKHREDEEAISMLRAKVEESRFVSLLSILDYKLTGLFTDVALCGCKLRAEGNPSSPSTLHERHLLSECRSYPHFLSHPTQTPTAVTEDSHHNPMQVSTLPTPASSARFLHQSLNPPLQIIIASRCLLIPTDPHHRQNKKQRSLPRKWTV